VSIGCSVAFNDAPRVRRRVRCPADPRCWASRSIRVTISTSPSRRKSSTVCSSSRPSVVVPEPCSPRRRRAPCGHRDRQHAARRPKAPCRADDDGRSDAPTDVGLQELGDGRSWRANSASPAMRREPEHRRAGCWSTNSSTHGSTARHSRARVRRPGLYSREQHKSNRPATARAD
jgi:hypothetical protein